MITPSCPGRVLQEEPAMRHIFLGGHTTILSTGHISCSNRCVQARPVREETGNPGKRVWSFDCMEKTWTEPQCHVPFRHASPNRGESIVAP